MGRWEPDAPGRLRQAAFELFAEQGYERTTVAEIAARAGVTERTFFRHFADKREVLFDGSERFRDAAVEAARAAPAGAGALEAARVGIEAAGSLFPPLALVRRRHELILANPELQERELIKLASLATALGQALRSRGAPAAAADLAAQTAIAVLQAAFVRWLEDPAERPWRAHVEAAMEELRRLAADAGLAA